MLLRLAPIIFVVLWSGGYTAIRLALDHAEPLTLQVLRYGIVVGGLAPLLVVLRPRLPPRRVLWHLVRMGLLVQFAYFAACNLAQAFGMTAAGLALCLALQPILVALLAPWLAGEGGVGGRAWLGLVCGLAGCGAVILSGSAVGAQGWIGLAFGVLALGTLTAGALLERRGGAPVHPALSNFVLYGVGLLATLPLALLTETMRIDWSAGLAWPLLYLVIANSLVATTLLLMMIRAGGAARASALLFLVPPLASAIAWAVLGQAMAPLAWAGTALAAAGVALARRKAAG